MKALSIFSPGNIQYIETPLPTLRPKDVLARVCYSGICGTDLDIFRGDVSLVRDGFIKYPVRIGHEWSGIVESVGPEVTIFKPGDRVVSDNGVSCGVCPECLNGEYVKCKQRRSLGTINCWDGSFAEYILIPEWHLHQLPDGIPLDEAALIEPATIALHGLRGFGDMTGKTLTITGTGAIGLAAIRIARILGASRIILSGRKDAKLEIGRHLGADVVVNATRENLIEAVMKATQGEGSDLMLETSAAAECVRDAMKLLRPSGIFVTIAFYPQLVDGFDADAISTRAIQLRPGKSCKDPVQQIINMMTSKGLHIKELITHRIPFDKAADAFRNANEMSATRIKMLVEISKEK